MISSNGYAAVAESLSRDPDKETYVFRRFDKLTARNLLNLQGELMALQAELDDLDAKAALSPDPVLDASMMSWQVMEENSKDTTSRDGGEERRRIAVAKELAVKLKAYHKALLLSSEVLKLESPNNRVTKVHQHMMRHVSPNEREALDHAQDMAVLRPPTERDVLSRTLRDNWPFPASPAHTSESGEIEYRHEHHLTKLISILSVLIAVLLVVGPILALNFTSSQNARLGITIAFILFFASGLGLSTGISRDNIFVATATYSAVLVVFVSGNLGDVGGSGAFSASGGNASSLSSKGS